MNPLETKCNQAKNTLTSLKNLTPSNTTEIDDLMNKTDTLYSKSLDFASQGLHHLTSASGCASVSNKTSDLMKALLKGMSDVLNATGLDHIFDAIENLVSLAVGTAEEIVTKIAKALAPVLNDISSAISSVISKISSLNVIKELSATVSDMLTSITGIVSCAGSALLNNNDVDVSSLMGYIDPSKKVLFDHINTQVQNGKSFGDIRESSKSVIANHLDVSGKIDNAILAFS